MAGAFSSWRIALFDEQSVVESNTSSLYLAILLPLCLLVAGCGAALFWMVRFRARQAKEQQQFSAELAHEVRTPLANIRLYIELIIRTSTTEQDKFCSVVVSEIERLSLLVDNAILMARPQNSFAVPSSERVDPDQLVRQTLDMMWPVLNVSGCEIESDLNVNQTVDMDRDALQRVLINLLDNAQKYAGGSQVSVQSRIDDQQVTIEVADQGPGLKQDIWDQIAHGKPKRARQGGRGFGLGLQVCIRLCKRLNGTFELLPSQRGTHYRISMPTELATVN
jgi:signal transduction histidine kinase